MTRAQIEQLDAIPERSVMTVEIIGRDNQTTAVVNNSITGAR